MRLIRSIFSLFFFLILLGNVGYSCICGPWLYPNCGKGLCAPGEVCVAKEDTCICEPETTTTISTTTTTTQPTTTTTTTEETTTTTTTTTTSTTTTSTTSTTTTTITTEPTTTTTTTSTTTSSTTISPPAPSGGGGEGSADWTHCGDGECQWFETKKECPEDCVTTTTMVPSVESEVTGEGETTTTTTLTTTTSTLETTTTIVPSPGVTGYFAMGMGWLGPLLILIGLLLDLYAWKKK